MDNLNKIVKINTNYINEGCHNKTRLRKYMFLEFHLNVKSHGSFLLNNKTLGSRCKIKEIFRNIVLFVLINNFKLLYLEKIKDK